MPSISRQFHRGARARFLFELRTIDDSRSLLVAGFLAVGHDLGRQLEVLLRLD